MRIGSRGTEHPAQWQQGQKLFFDKIIKNEKFVAKLVIRKDFTDRQNLE
jgi:hypothetical protein